MMMYCDGMFRRRRSVQEEECSGGRVFWRRSVQEGVVSCTVYTLP
jgi:hypothetical protein